MPDLQGMIDTGSNSFWSLLLAIAVVGISLFVGRWVRRKVRRVLKEIEGLDEYAGATLGRFAGWAVVMLGIVLALTVLGVDMVAISLLIVIILALVVLMGRPLIQSWGAGLLLQARAPFRPGDRIETMNYIGYVEEVNARSVVMRTGDGQIVHIPNLDVVQNPLVNRTGHDGR
ncbi:MAG: mechanosensitive ion channel, partial [Actinobacteria bacterium]|nr:mechanosensitive ion channel [Actinomycetota bacterium]